MSGPRLNVRRRRITCPCGHAQLGAAHTRELQKLVAIGIVCQGCDRQLVERDEGFRTGQARFAFEHVS